MLILFVSIVYFLVTVFRFCFLSQGFVLDFRNGGNCRRPVWLLYLILDTWCCRCLRPIYCCYILSACWVFSYFRNQPNSDMDYVIIMRACTYGDWAHRQRVSTTVWTRADSQGSVTRFKPRIIESWVRHCTTQPPVYFCFRSSCLLSFTSIDSGIFRARYVFLI